MMQQNDEVPFESVVDVYASMWERGAVSRQTALRLAAYAVVMVPAAHEYLAARFRLADWRVTIRRGEAPHASGSLGLEEGLRPFFPTLEAPCAEQPEVSVPPKPKKQILTETTVHDLAPRESARAEDSRNGGDEPGDRHRGEGERALGEAIGVALRDAPSPRAETEDGSSHPRAREALSGQLRRCSYTVARAARILDTTPAALRAQLQRLVAKDGLTEKGVDLGGGVVAHKLGARCWRIWIAS